MASRSAVSSSLYLAICVLAMAGALFLPESPPALKWAGAGLVAVFIALEWSNATRLQRGVGVVLTSAGVALGLVGGEALGVLLEGIHRALLFLLLFFAVAWIAEPAQRSPALEAVRAWILDQPAGRRFSMLAGGAHGLGAFLNMAGMSLLSDMVARQTDEKLKKRLAVALMLGFVSASAWSPFYISIAVVLIALPELTWFDIGPPGLVTALAILVVLTALDHVFARGAKPVVRDVPRLDGKARRDVTILVTLMFAGVVGLKLALDAPIPVILAIFAPPFAMAWMATITSDAGAPKTLFRIMFTRLPALRSETLTFVGANVFGVGVAAAINEAWLLEVFTGPFWAAGGWVDAFKVGVLAAALILAGLAGVHPVIVVILVGSVLPPDIYGLPAWVMAVVMAATWGISSTGSPFSGTTLFVSRLTGDSPYWLAWRCGAPYAAACGLVVAVMAYILWKSGFFPLT